MRIQSTLQTPYIDPLPLLDDEFDMLESIQLSAKEMWEDTASQETFSEDVELQDF